MAGEKPISDHPFDPTFFQLSTDIFIMERGPRYKAYADLRESKLRQKSTAKNPPPLPPKDHRNTNNSTPPEYQSKIPVAEKSATPPAKGSSRLYEINARLMGSKSSVSSEKKGGGVPPIKFIEKKKKDYKEAKKILKLICDEIELKYSGTHNPCYRRPIIEATCHGVYEVVDEILVRSPEAIRFMNRNGHNIIQLAIINRSENIYGLIYHTVKRKDFYRTIMDSSKSNILHLAGRLAPSFRLSRTTGAALQLQRELQWFKEVEKLMLPTDLVKENIDMETPEMVFTREHEDLVKEGEKWMKATAESSSITVALIITIVFAAAITVPGGSNQETGIPLFSKEIAFTIFAVSDAFSLFASLAALLVFLSILSTRFAEQDFLVRLPRRLMIGLFLLFISTTAMLVAFCAILFLVLCDQRAWMVAPISGLVCMPIIVIATLQLPLVVELFGSTYISIFAKGSYIDSCKSNLNNMQSFFDRLRIEHES